MTEGAPAFPGRNSEETKGKERVPLAQVVGIESDTARIYVPGSDKHIAISAHFPDIASHDNYMSMTGRDPISFEVMGGTFFVELPHHAAGAREHELVNESDGVLVAQDTLAAQLDVTRDELVYAVKLAEEGLISHFRQRMFDNLPTRPS